MPWFHAEGPGPRAQPRQRRPARIFSFSLSLPFFLENVHCACFPPGALQEADRFDLVGGASDIIASAGGGDGNLQPTWLATVMTEPQDDVLVLLGLLEYREQGRGAIDRKIGLLLRKLARVIGFRDGDERIVESHGFARDAAGFPACVVEEHTPSAFADSLFEEFIIRVRI